LRFAFTVNENGRLKYPELGVRRDQEVGKATLATIIMLVMILLFGGRFVERYCDANDYEQAASRVFAGQAHSSARCCARPLSLPPTGSDCATPRRELLTSNQVTWNVFHKPGKVVVNDHWLKALKTGFKLEQGQWAG
jgi:hypothetical protein